MNIFIPIKQVPETGNVQMDRETGTMVRTGVESIVNPLDLYAVEAGLRMKEEHAGRITVFSMGPRGAESALREALSMGCDRAMLITGREFAGADTYATAFTLARAVEKLGEPDLILCGERATDGETGQVGPGLASLLDLPLATFTSSIRTVKKTCIVVERLIESGYETLKLPLPALVTVVKEIAYPRLPTLRGKQRARRAEIPIWDAAHLDLKTDQAGLSGSPTRVVRIQRPTVTREGTTIHADSEEKIDDAVTQTVRLLEAGNLLPGGGIPCHRMRCGS